MAAGPPTAGAPHRRAIGSRLGVNHSTSRSGIQLTPPGIPDLTSLIKIKIPVIGDLIRRLIDLTPVGGRVEGVGPEDSADGAGLLSI